MFLSNMYKMGFILVSLFSGGVRADELSDIFDPTESEEIADLAFPSSPQWQFQSLDTEIDCLAKNIYFESGREPYIGQIAIGLVTINRLKSHHYPDTICDVVWQITKNKHGKRVAQFSWTLDGKPDIPKNIGGWERSMAVARQLLANASLNNFTDFTEGATHYHADYVSPKWKREMEKVTKIGLHIFYRP